MLLFLIYAIIQQHAIPTNTLNLFITCKQTTAFNFFFIKINLKVLPTCVVNIIDII